MMDKNKYLDKLEARLDRLPIDELGKVLQEYEKYFDEAGKENEQDLIDELGSPKFLAEKILDDYYYDNLMEVESKKRKGSRTLVLALTFYIWIPVTLVVYIFDTVLTALGSVAAILGLFVVISGIISMFSSIATGLFFIGAGLVLISLGILIFISGIVLYKISGRMIMKLFGKSERGEDNE